MNIYLVPDLNKVVCAYSSCSFYAKGHQMTYGFACQVVMLGPGQCMQLVV